jgi:hypothetical protein
MRTGQDCSSCACAADAGTRSSILNTMTDSTKDPLFGFIRRSVTAKQVQEAIVRGVFTLLHIVFLTPSQDGTENPFTRVPHSDRYHKILKARKKLPVYTQMDDFYQMVSSAPPFVCGGAMEPLIPRSPLQPRPCVANSPESMLNIRLLS